MILLSPLPFFMSARVLPHAFTGTRGPVAEERGEQRRDCAPGRPPPPRAGPPAGAQPAVPRGAGGEGRGAPLPAVGSAGRSSGRAAGPGRQIPQPRCHLESIARGARPLGVSAQSPRLPQTAASLGGRASRVQSSLSDIQMRTERVVLSCYYLS